MHNEPLSPQQAAEAHEPVAMHQTVQTQSYKTLLGYAVPYTLGYVFIAPILTSMKFPITGLALSILVVLMLHALLISFFKKRHGRYLEPLECHRLGLLIALLALVITSVLMLRSLYEQPLSSLSLNQMVENGTIAMLVISGAIGLFINYMVVRFGLLGLQKLWPKFNAN
ncbi:hypothetical protein [Psychrobacter sp. FDAARGOS_221]|uniref:hypothetical protein n=1 Tax=Psychrobacter sp. FDAARGOS_221 TaxID=1975705 RepID=UPI000BB576E9|nr:hypothetical protein [Psychrobacter sp. FDAARGOS_221]PNK61318.1 hypothetical protein A6J60_010865 [Psychrobacter sp. FDAARGOS_221]